MTGAALQDNGKILLTGYSCSSGAKVIRFTSAGQLDSAVTRLTPAGARDDTHSGDGITSVNLGANDYLRAAAVDAGDLLAKRKKIRMTATIVARDTAGNATTKKVSFTLKASKRKR